MRTAGNDQRARAASFNRGLRVILRVASMCCDKDKGKGVSITIISLLYSI